jgi:nicotinamidase-related amidase
MSIHQTQMPLCQRDYCQLLIIDGQERLAAAMDPGELQSVVDNINRLIGAARSVGVPVIATQHNS